MKGKVLVGGLCLALTLSFVGCGGQPAQQLEDNKPTEPTEQTAPTATVQPDSVEVKQEAEAVKAEVAPADTEPKEDKPVEEVKPDEKAEEPEDLFTVVDETVYATSSVNLRSGPGTEYEKAGALGWGDAVNRIGVGTYDVDGWSRIKLADGSIVYVSSKYLSATKPVSSGGNAGGGDKVNSGSQGVEENSGSQGVKENKAPSSETTVAPQQQQQQKQDVPSSSETDKTGSSDEIKQPKRTEVDPSTLSEIEKEFIEKGGEIYYDEYGIKRLVRPDYGSSFSLD